MPLVDLPLEKLYDYQGRNPRPADFDEYWQRGLAELDTFQSEIEFRKPEISIPGAEFREIWFDGLGGAKLFAKLAIPTWRPGPHPCVLHFHGYYWKSTDWTSLASWTAAGFAVLAPDVRGQGGQSTDPISVKGNTLRGHIVRGLDDDPDKLFYRAAYLDTVLQARMVADMPEIDADRIFAHGASQGGGLTLACAALSPLIKKCAPVYPFLCDYQRVWEMDLANAAYEELKLFFRIQDPLHEREQEVFDKLGYIDCQHLAPRITCPTLMATGLMDTTCPPSTQFAAYNKLGGPKDVVVYPDFGHEGLIGITDKVMQFFLQ